RYRDSIRADLNADQPTARRLPPRLLGGMFLWLRLPEGADATALLPLALQRQVAYVPGTAFYATAPAPRNTLRLSYATATPQQIDTAIARLGELFAAARGASARSDSALAL
ncbi:MAG: aminotransferase class I/II-fold pyridoxal phosphate-dependent enzyme, partial [Thiomonas sp.]